MDPATIIALGAAATKIIPSIFGGGKSEKEDVDYKLGDTGIYAGDADMRLLLGEGAGDYTAQMLMEAMGDPNGWMSGSGLGGGHVSAGHANAGYATAAEALASLINMDDVAYQERPPEDLTEDVYGRMSRATGAQTAGQTRALSNEMTLSGQSSTSPFALYMKQKIQEEGAKRASEGLTQFYDTFVMGALGRRAQGLTTNAQLQTGVNQQNAQMQTQVSMGNAANSTQASIANAGYATQASSANASLGMQAAGLGMQRNAQLLDYLTLMLRPVDHLQQIGSTGSASQDPGSGQRMAGVGSGLRELPWEKWFPSSGGGGGGGGIAVDG